jgi:hypothetical protein
VTQRPRAPRRDCRLRRPCVEPTDNTIRTSCPPNNTGELRPLPTAPSLRAGTTLQESAGMIGLSRGAITDRLVGTDGVADLAEALHFDGERVGVGDRPAE